ncbi:MAG: Ribonucleoside-triphosphate reductase class III catalytic subunit [Parcubacteria group bacterium GW2011_GWE2_39_37]|uniref:Ribonucleoside-triphosphate reductase class III catalytic subunit n=1 Tax=Candidatus Falkowbacteria bacterium GW2011_GWF2_39_8 TaxID=1618642 RepID=A0A0G0S9R5_9BACT|nr:MAG: Ribonucleoside-triphosphate reductase class III catalytic subunit [Parcubacteria group bacterium GW2011_GWE2_39_37]KKR31510.1 MAG: Ribonucleoside-triphosphate reductase class III catalytic subunit [Candidatus Falkowbacteria bacterium GW2011_GWF2_39_8]
MEFNEEKISHAIFKATEAVGEPDQELAEKLTKEVVGQIAKRFHPRSIPAVEEIQDIVEEVLISSRKIDIAKAYIIYRDQHRQLRELNSRIDEEKLMQDYLGQADWRLKENSNMSFSVQGLNNYIASSVSARYWLNKLYPDAIRDAHVNADFHIHDLGMLAPYCCGWDLKDILIKGFAGVSEKVQSKPPKHFRSTLGQVVNFLYTMQGEAAGAQAFANFDTYLAPFIRYDDLTYREVKQCLQEFMFNVNVPTRVGFQTPFINVTLDITPSKKTGEENVVIGGKYMPEKYNEFQAEMDMFNKAFAEVMIEGDATGRVFAFPIPTYNVDKNFNWDSEVLKPVWEMTAKYGIPYFSNFINSDMDRDDARSMCCRLRLDNRELRKRGGGLFGANPLTGSLGVVTINLARLGYLSKTKEEFFERLEKLMDLAKESLEIKRKVIERFTEDGLYPYSKFYLVDIYARFKSYWQNHFNTIGINGMNEALVNLTGENVGSEKGKEMALEILDFMRNKLMDYQNETNNLYNLEATPAEGVTYRFAKKDKELYPDIIVANNRAVEELGADPYYTNSTHLPVDFTNDIFEALDLQDELQTKYTGGTVLHGFLGEKINDPEAAKRLVKKIAENYRLPYYTITPTFSICPKHGYLSGEHQYCPKCDEEMGYVQVTEIRSAVAEEGCVEC